jgi:uncharacterized protein with PQ loop repeat
MISRCKFMHLLFHLRNNLITILLHPSHTPYLLRNIYISLYTYWDLPRCKSTTLFITMQIILLFFFILFFYEEKRAKSEEKKRKEKFIFHP